MNFETIEKLPNSMGDNITTIPEYLKSETVVNPNGKLENTISPDEAFKTADHTKIEPILLNTNNQQQQQQANVNASARLGDMLESKLAIELVDAVLPGILVAAMYALKIEMTKKELQLTEKEKTTITPIFQKCLDTIYLNFSSPWTLLAVTIGVIYGSKVTEKGIVAYIDKKNEEKKNPIVTEPTNYIKPENEIFNQPAQTILNNISTAPINPIVENFVAWEITEDKIAAAIKRRKQSRQMVIDWMKGLLQKKKKYPY